MPNNSGSGNRRRPTDPAPPPDAPKARKPPVDEGDTWTRYNRWTGDVTDSLGKTVKTIRVVGDPRLPITRYVNQQRKKGTKGY